LRNRNVLNFQATVGVARSIFQCPPLRTAKYQAAKNRQHCLEKGDGQSITVGQISGEGNGLAIAKKTSKDGGAWEDDLSLV
jgi:hypothetical protein